MADFDFRLMRRRLKPRDLDHVTMPPGAKEALGGQTPVHKASDFLFCVETLFRRAEQQAEAKKNDPKLLLSHEAANAES